MDDNGHVAAASDLQVRCEAPAIVGRQSALTAMNNKVHRFGWRREPPRRARVTVMVQSNSMLLKEFFSVPGKPISLAELKALTSEDRQELGALVAAAIAEGDVAQVAA
jgi:hypothetical protein